MTRFDGKLSPVCREKFTSDSDIVVCPDCGTPHHRECYTKTNKCALYKGHGSFVWEGTIPGEKFIDSFDILHLTDEQREMLTRLRGQVRTITEHYKKSYSEIKTLKGNNNITNIELPEEVLSQITEDMFALSLIQKEIASFIKANDPADISADCYLSVERLKNDVIELSYKYTNILNYGEEGKSFDTVIRDEVIMMTGLHPVPDHPELDRAYDDIIDKLSDPIVGNDGLSSRELTFYTALSSWHFYRAFAKSRIGMKSGFNLPSGLFAPVYQFFRRIDWLGFVILAVIAIAEGVPPLLMKLNVVSVEVGNVLSIIGAFLILASVVLLCVFGDYIYYRHAAKKIRKIREKYGEEYDQSIEYYRELTSAGKPSLLKGIFGFIVYAFIQVFIQVFIVR